MNEAWVEADELQEKRVYVDDLQETYIATLPIDITKQIQDLLKRHKNREFIAKIRPGQKRHIDEFVRSNRTKTKVLCKRPLDVKASLEYALSIGLVAKLDFVCTPRGRSVVICPCCGSTLIRETKDYDLRMVGITCFNCGGYTEQWHGDRKKTFTHQKLCVSLEKPKGEWEETKHKE